MYWEFNKLYPCVDSLIGYFPTIHFRFIILRAWSIVQPSIFFIFTCYTHKHQCFTFICFLSYCFLFKDFIFKWDLKISFNAQCRKIHIYIHVHLINILSPIQFSAPVQESCSQTTCKGIAINWLIWWTRNILCSWNYWTKSFSNPDLIWPWPSDPKLWHNVWKSEWST